MTSSGKIRVFALVRGTATAEVGRAVLGSVVFVIVARTLGAESVGLYSATLAIVGFFSPFAGLSSGHWILRRVRRECIDGLPLLSRGVLLIIVTGLPFATAACALCYFLLHAEIWTALLLALSELVLTALVNLLGFYTLAKGSSLQYATVMLAPSVTKLSFALLLPFFSMPSLQIWAVLYGSASFSALIVASLCVMPKLVRPESFCSSDLRWCLQVSSTQLAQGAVNDLDKPFLVANGNLDAAGQYAGAYKLLSLSFFVAKAVQTATYPEFFTAEKQGYTSVMNVLNRALVFACGYGALCVVVALVGAPLATVILGPSFEDVPTYIRWLCLLLPIKFIQWFVADALTGLDRQGARTVLQICAAVLTVVFLFLLVPPFGVSGAIATTLVVEVSYTVALVYVLRGKSSRMKRTQ